MKIHNLKKSVFIVLAGAVLANARLFAQTENSGSSTKPSTGVNLVTKEYPDGTRQVVRWADLGGGSIDRGESHGGPPKIVPFDPKRDGFVPIGKDEALSEPVKSPMVTQVTQPLARPKSLETYEPDALYARFQIGLTVLNDQSIQQVNGVSSSTNLTFDPGIRGTIELGGDLMEYLALEGNIGVAWNSCNQGSDAGLFQIPAMIGLLGKYPIEVDGGPKLTPYFGIDGGVEALLYDSLSFVDQGEGGAYSGSPYFISPVWQIRTGVMVALQDKWNLVAGYSFMGTWGSLGTNSNLNPGFLGTSTIEIGFQTQF